MQSINVLPSKSACVSTSRISPRLPYRTSWPAAVQPLPSAAAICPAPRNGAGKLKPVTPERMDLGQTLRRMKTMALAERRRYAEAPPRVEYSLRKAGRDLLVPIFALGAWADEHGDIVRAAMFGES